MQDIDSLVLAHGSHPDRGTGMCAMEAVAWLNGEAHSDAPFCTASPVRKFVIATNDWCNDEERQQLKPYLSRLISTSSVGHGADVKAAYLFADWAVREVAPAALESLGYTEQAAALRGLAPIVDRETALAGRDAARAARPAAAAASVYAAYAASAAADASVYAASAAAYAAERIETRADSMKRRLAILDRVLTEAYEH